MVGWYEHCPVTGLREVEVSFGLVEVAGMLDEPTVASGSDV